MEPFSRVMPWAFAWDLVVAHEWRLWRVGARAAVCGPLPCLAGVASCCTRCLGDKAVRRMVASGRQLGMLAVTAWAAHNGAAVLFCSCGVASSICVVTTGRCGRWIDPGDGVLGLGPVVAALWHG